ncbi:hypothetical protein LshimejAT787_1104760 [Lyophyllum shimeji]|uniref:F-box domain-containing protein n=1 Tax=Lyophyllum shimeji TaxID=47721 RepID=A0A9P3UTS6_LYOSH|nr:hypothetical protein LshimejAT787_1104760 [Lyophyllum shimeji]
MISCEAPSHAQTRTTLDLQAADCVDGLHANRGTIAPVHLLPDEILQEIFLACLPAELRECRPTRSQAPLLLCQVCSRWRSLALSTPQLWSSLYIYLSRDEDEDEGEEEGNGDDQSDHDAGVVNEHPVQTTPAFETLIEEWFRRLGPDMPLSLGFEFPDLDPSDYPALEKVTRCILHSHSHRLRELSLRFFIEDENFLSILFSPLEHFEQLEVLSLIAIEGATEHDCMGLFSLPSAPHLRRVLLRSVLVNSYTLERALPWSQLTSIEIDDIHPSPLRHVLTLCTNLEHGSLTVRGLLDTPFPSVAKPFALPRLSDLKIRFFGGGNPSFFNGLELPALRSFHIMTDETDPCFSWTHPRPEPLYDQLRNLTHLSFAGRLSDIVNLLRHTASLRTLTIASNDYLDPLWHAMTCQDDASSLVPTLEMLRVRPYGFKEIRLSWAPSFSSASFAAMVQSRMLDRVPHGVCPLRKIVFEGNDVHLITVESLLQGVRALDGVLPILSLQEEDD